MDYQPTNKGIDMKDTVGNEIQHIIPNCPAKCGSTSGCVSCNPSLRTPIECLHIWEECSWEVEHCPNCSRHRKINTKIHLNIP